MKSPAFALFVFLVAASGAFLVAPAHAQSGPSLSPLSLQGVLGNFEKAPTPKDQYGNPIPVPQPTEAEREAARKEQAARAAKIRADEVTRKAVEARLAAEERRAAELLAEEKSFHDRVMNAIYIGLAILAALVALVLFKRSN